MIHFDLPTSLPVCQGILPEMRSHLSTWALGMGRAQPIIDLLPGLNTLGQGNPDCMQVAQSMALWGLHAYPLETDMSRWVLRFKENGMALSTPSTRLCARLASLPALDETDTDNTQLWHTLARQDDYGLIIRFLTIVLGDTAKGLTWLGHCWQDLIYLPKSEIAKAALDMVRWDDATLPLKARLMAEWAFHRLPPSEALSAIEQLDADTWGLWRAYAGAELLIRTGNSVDGIQRFSALWKAIPWHVNLTLKLYDLHHPPVPVDTVNTGDAAILLYSWNKADLLADTLESLAQSDIGDAHIFTLDNGSTDHTAEVLTKAQEQFGRERFHIESLPINVGAPAARNWLLALPEVRSCAWAAFLDDDIILPKDWLRQLLGAAQGREDIGAVGCRITAATEPYGLQAADFNLFPITPPPTPPDELPNRVLLFDNCGGSPDMGQFTYTRPCLSVTGCCHLISLKAIDKAGPFDLRYTPSQFDDLDRDLRSSLAGMPAVYAGNLAIRHIQHSSLAKAQTTRQIGHVMGNKFKLDTKYSDEELMSLAQKHNDELWSDLIGKHNFLIDHLA